MARLLFALDTVPGSPALNLVVLIDNLSVIARSAAELRTLQGHGHQAAAATRAAVRLRRCATQMTAPVPAVHVTRQSGRGRKP